MKKILLISLLFLFSCSLFIREKQQIDKIEIKQEDNKNNYKENNYLNLVQTGLIQTGIILKESKIFNPKDLDLESDYSITKFVSNNVSFNNLKYKPNDLIKIKGQYIIDVKGNQVLRKEAKEKLDLLSKDFFNHFQVKLKIISAYRSYDYQVGIKLNGCSDSFCAKPGFSEHQSGLAFDIFETSNQKQFLSNNNYKKYFEWMMKNAYKYGFHNTYQKGKEIDGYEIEPWHWRYVGVDLATYLHENNLTFGEFYKLIKK